jgi:hypothetical protein
MAIRLPLLLSERSLLQWANDTVRTIEANFAKAEITKQTIGAIARLPVYAKAALPPAAPAGQMIYVSDDTGGAVVAFSDGSDWRRVTDRAVIA